MNKHLMLDFETLSNTPNSAVISLGAVLFTREKVLEERDWVFSLDDQLAARLDVNIETIAWWIGQSEKAREVFNQVKIGIQMRPFLDQFTAWIGAEDVRVWGNGATFDVAIIENLIRRGNRKIPWKFWNVRCYRTLKSFYPNLERLMPRMGELHRAIDDAKYQTSVVMEFLKNNPGCDN